MSKPFKVYAPGRTSPVRAFATEIEAALYARRRQLLTGKTYTFEAPVKRLIPDNWRHYGAAVSQRRLSHYVARPRKDMTLLSVAA